MKFDLEKFRKKELFVHCATREDANDFLRYLYNIGGFGWSNSRSYLIDENRWMIYQSSTCYSILGGTELYVTDYDDNSNLNREIVQWVKEVVVEPVKVENKFRYLITDNKNVNSTMLLNESQKRLLNKLSDMKLLNVKSVTELMDEGFKEI